MGCSISIIFLIAVSFNDALSASCSQHSNLLNQARLSVLKSRDDSVKGIVEETKSHLGDVTKDAPRYKKMLEELVAQVSVCLIFLLSHF